MNLRMNAWWIIPALLMGLILTGILCIGVYLEQGDKARVSVNEDRFDDIIREASEKHMPPGWDWLILKSMIKQESKFDPDAGNGDYRGLMQFSSSTAKSVGLPPAKRTDPESAVNAGARYLRDLWNIWTDIPDGKPGWDRTRYAIASYNAGPGRVRSAASGAGNPGSFEKLSSRLPSGARRHVSHVMSYFREYRSSGRYPEPSGSFRSSGRGVRFWINPFSSE